MTDRSAFVLPGIVLLGSLFLPSRAEAEGGVNQWVFGVSPSYAYLVRDDRSEPDGGGVSIFVHYGLTEAIDIRFSGLWTGHDIDPSSDDGDNPDRGGLFQVMSFAIGGRYAFDFLPASPAIEIGLGVLHLMYQDSSSTDLNLQVGVSLDYWVLDWLSVGAAFHYHAFLVTPSEYPIYFDAGPRVAVRWP